MQFHSLVRARLQILKFLFAGILNTAVGYITFVVIYGLLESLFMISGVAASVVMSLVVSLAFSYQMQKRFVWKRVGVELQPEFYTKPSESKESHNRKMGLRKRKTIYTTYYLSIAGLNIASVRLWQESLSLDPRIGQAIFTITSSFISFFFLRWLFREIEG